MMPYMIQPTGTVNYEFIDKPIKYTPTFLASLTGEISCDVCDEHNGAKITKTKEIIFKDNKLYAIFEDEINLSKKGFSTRIEPLEFKEYPDYYEIIKGNLLNVDLTSNPRNQATILENSKTKIINGDGMDEAILNEKNQVIGGLKTEVNNFKEANEKLKQDLNEQKEAAKKIEEDNKNLMEQLKSDKEDFEKKLNNYHEKEQESIEQLANDLSQGDESLLGIYKKMSIGELETIKTKNNEHDEAIKEKYSKEKGFRGVPAGAGNHNNSGNNDEHDEDFDFVKIAETYGIKI